MAHSEKHQHRKSNQCKTPRGIVACRLRWCLILGMLGFVSLFLLSCGTATDSDQASYRKPLQIRYGFTVTNTTNQLARDVRLRAFAPMGQTTTHKRVKTIASHPFDELDDGAGNPVLVLRLGELPPYASRVVTIVTDLLVASEPIRTIAENENAFMTAEKYVESDHSAVVDLAHSLKKSDVHATARNVFDWVAGNLKYSGYHKNPRGALQALKQRQGDCTEFMDAFIALCRANGIPARGMGGYLCNRNTVLKPAGYHNWAEFYDGRTWCLADPQNKVFLTGQADYIATHVIRGPAGLYARNAIQYEAAGKGITVQMNIF